MSYGDKKYIYRMKLKNDKRVVIDYYDVAEVVPHIIAILDKHNKFYTVHENASGDKLIILL